MARTPHPNNVRARICADSLRALYVERRMTVIQVATLFAVAPTTIRRRLRDVEIAVRPRGPAPIRSHDDGRDADATRSWPSHLAYAVGVIVTGGNLSRDGRHLSVSSKDVELLETVRRGKDPRYVYARLYVSIVSASGPFLEWMRTTLRRLRGVEGHLTVRRIAGRHDLWCLRYAKRESVTLLRWLYYAPTAPALRRKREHAERAVGSATWYRRSLADDPTL